jgi:excisionase family DNA binding protein
MKKTALNKQVASTVIEAAERMLTKPEMAQLVRRKEKTIERWMQAGRLPYLRVGRTILFPLREVMSHLKEKYGRNLAA